MGFPHAPEPYVQASLRSINIFPRFDKGIKRDGLRFSGLVRSRGTQSLPRAMQCPNRQVTFSIPPRAPSADTVYRLPVSYRVLKGMSV